ncbi:uncharacterized protein EAF02_002846 [Botrytis sinoallii]|uniref:uncharacterized protein n=1 Tax=Botrytis sinoallii TaxID=1463999 RepID=UPI001901574A|nr:uncharacterized protein EAF02_002846 [Botrytis sinoallii]KAF7888305.1 hypothetical protein EAF02_002846 [Botrytis sinoallii]
MEPSPPDSVLQTQEESMPNTPKSWQFYLILFSLSFISFVAALDGSIIATALPKITNDLSAADNYVWVANSFLIAQTVVQPLCAQICNIFGRRAPMFVSISLFMLGSGIVGGSNSSTMLIAGRTVQGLGSGGIMMLVELIICDIVPLRERGKYLGIVMSSTAIAAILGPAVGGALATVNWRWLFYLNLPIAGVTMVFMAISLRLHHEKESTWARALLRIDWVGNFIFIASLCFHLYEWKPPNFCKEVFIPPRIFANRTSSAGFYIDFISSVLLQWVCFFWPVFFQAIKGTSPLRAGTNFIPYEAFLIVTAGMAGGILSKFGHYRPLHLVGFVLSILGLGLNIMLSNTTPKVSWVIFQMVDAIGRGILLPTVLPAIMASLPDSDVATATGLYSFLRSFGFIWGITIPGIIFNAQFDRYSNRISDPAVRQELAGGRAYQFVSGTYIHSLEPTIRQQVISVYREALKSAWIGAVAFGCTGLVAVCVERHISLRTKLDTQFGLKSDKLEKNQEKKVSVPEDIEVAL